MSKRQEHQFTIERLDGEPAAKKDNVTGASNAAADVAVSRDAEVVGSQYELVRRIMSHSDMKDLKAFTKVSKLWKLASEREQASATDRLTPVLFSHQGRAHDTHISLRNYMSDPQHSRYTYRVETEAREKDEDDIAGLREFHASLDFFVIGDQMKRMDAAVAVMLSTSDDDEHYEKVEYDKKRDFVVEMVHVDKILPPWCKTLSLTNRGAISGSAEVENLNVMRPLTPAAGMLVFPAFQHIRITPFQVSADAAGPDEEGGPSSDESSDDDWDFDNGYGERPPGGGRRRNRRRRRAAAAGAVTREQHMSLFQSATNNQIPTEEQVKCCIVLENYGTCGTPAEKFVDAVLNITDGQVAIGGCIGTLARYSHGPTPNQKLFDLFREQHKEDEDWHLPNDYTPLNVGKSVGLVFSVTEEMSDRLQACSFLLPRHVRGVKQVRAALLKAKESAGFPFQGATSSCAFLFSCCARGTKFHRKDSVELSTFRSVFPETPVIGLFVLGEIGHTYMGPGNTSNSCNNEKPGSLPNLGYNTKQNLRHQMCSVFVLLAFKQP